jgi:hypothetical protein
MHFIVYLCDSIGCLGYIQYIRYIYSVNMPTFMLIQRRLGVLTTLSCNNCFFFNPDANNADIQLVIYGIYKTIAGGVAELDNKRTMD